MTVVALRPPKHPAKYSQPILDKLGAMLLREARRVQGRVAGTEAGITVLDPFAGVGRIHQLQRPGRILTLGLEIEQDWAACHHQTVCTDALVAMRHPDMQNRFHAIATSPCYGNRLADHHNAADGSRRRSYRHDLGHMPADGSSATMHWGPRYWEFHAVAYRLMLGCLVPGGLALINVSNFYKGKRLIHAVEWHRGALMGAGFVHGGRDVKISTARLQGVGAEATAARADHEVILVVRRPEVDQ